MTVYFLVQPIFSSPEKDPEQTGPLVTPTVLPKLDSQQLAALQMAKKYCQTISAKHVREEPDPTVQKHKNLDG